MDPNFNSSIQVNHQPKTKKKKETVENQTDPSPHQKEKFITFVWSWILDASKLMYG